MPESNHRLYEPSPKGPCHSCAYQQGCPGLAGDQSELFGCFGSCGDCGAADGNCSFTCPGKPEEFFRNYAEIGGLAPTQRRDLPSPTTQLPLYVPMIRHSGARRDVLPRQTVALDTFRVITGDCRPRVRSAASLRRRFKVDAKAKLLLISVQQDKWVEGFWQSRSAEKLKALAALNLLAMTTPNFSFFDEAPRTDTKRNFWRIIRSAEELADAGIHPILHLNAQSGGDWEQWLEVLRNTPSATYVCKEFQTGLKNRERGLTAIADLARLRDRLGRELHVVAVAGRRYLRTLAREFERLTIVDSVPFISAVHRKRIMADGSRYRRIDWPLAVESPLDNLLNENVGEYEALVERRAAEARASRTGCGESLASGGHLDLAGPLASTLTAPGSAFESAIRAYRW